MGRLTPGADTTRAADVSVDVASELNDQFEHDLDEAVWCSHEPQTFSCELDEADSAYVLGAMQERGQSDREAFTREALINHSHA